MIEFFIFASAEISPDFVSRKVMEALGTDYSHVGIIVSVQGQGDGTIHHAVGEGVCTQNVSHFLETHTFKQLFDITPFVSRPEFALGWLTALIGLEYSDSQYAGFLMPFLKRLVDNDKSKFICSELCAEFLNACSSIRYFEGANCDFVDPKQVVEGLKVCLQKDGTR